MTAAVLRGPALPGLAAGLAGSLLAAITVTVAGLTGPASLLGVLVYLVGAALVATHWRGGPLGAANLVTLARLVGTSAVAGLLVGHHAADRTPTVLFTIVGIAVGCLLLDGVDGQVARARGTASRFGARFDVEADAALVLLLSIASALFSPTGWWVIMIGLLRYLYVAAAAVVPALRTPLPERLARKIISVGVNVGLIAVLGLAALPHPPALLGSTVLATGMAALCWSFARDVGWQLGAAGWPAGHVRCSHDRTPDRQ